VKRQGSRFTAAQGIAAEIPEGIGAESPVRPAGDDAPISVWGRIFMEKQKESKKI
jgi:hypothetical protein